MVCVPAPAKRALEVIKAPPAVHEVPLYSSVQDPYGVWPPKASPAFCVPVPAKWHLAVIKAPPADHDDPLYSSVQDVKPGGPGILPPKASVEFCSPAPAKKFLATITCGFLLMSLFANIPVSFAALNEPELLKDIAPGTQDFYPDNFVELNGNVYFKSDMLKIYVYMK